MIDRPALEDLDDAPESARWCCNSNAEDCALCTDPNPPYPFLCPGHPRTAGNERIVGEATQSTELDKGRRYLHVVQSYAPGETHLSIYQWLPMFDAWATGMSLCGGTMRQGSLPEGTAMTCAKCEEWRPKYERMLTPGYRPEDDDPKTLRRRVEASERLHETHLEVERRLAAEAQTAESAIARVRDALEELKAQGATGMQFYIGVLGALEEPKRRTR